MFHTSTPGLSTSISLICRVMLHCNSVTSSVLQKHGWLMWQMMTPLTPWRATAATLFILAEAKAWQHTFVNHLVMSLMLQNHTTRSPNLKLTMWKSSVYRSQSACVEDLVQDIKTITDKDKITVVLGDFNICYIREPRNVLTQSLVHSGFSLLTTKATHISDGIIDHCYIKNPSIDAYIPDDNLMLHSMYWSDHDAMLLSLPKKWSASELTRSHGPDYESMFHGLHATWHSMTSALFEIEECKGVFVYNVSCGWDRISDTSEHQTFHSETVYLALSVTIYVHLRTIEKDWTSWIMWYEHPRLNHNLCCGWNMDLSLDMDLKAWAKLAVQYCTKLNRPVVKNQQR